MPPNKFLLTLLFFAISTAQAETKVQIIPLSAPLDNPKAELSSLAWCGDELVLMPQRPRFASDVASPTGYYFTLSKAQLSDHIKKPSKPALSAKAHRFDDAELRESLEGFDGYEALVCDGDKWWLSIEKRGPGIRYSSLIVAGKRQSNGDLILESKTFQNVESQSGIWNFSEETMLRDGDSLITIHEANGVIKEPSATRISLFENIKRRLPMAGIPFRITDATALDKDNKFWVTNYLWQGDQVLQEDVDWLAETFPPGASHEKTTSVERLIELQLNNNEITLTKRAPIYLELVHAPGRNWEGIARLDDLGLLIVSDEFPATHLGFVPFDDDWMI